MAAAALAVSQGVTNGPLSFFPEKKNYTDASAHCVGAGGHLASVHTPAENAVLADLCSAEECWIGFNDIEEEGLWVWKDGTDADFSKFPGGNPPWNPGEPNGQAWEKTDGAYVYPATNKWVQAGTWDDDDIAKKKSFVCRFADAPWAPPPPPSPPPLTHIGPFDFVAQKRSWEAAEQNCITRGGHLASIHSMAENKAIQELCDPHECWIGFNDLENEGTWVWTDRSEVDFSKFEGGVAPWNPGEPNGHNTTGDPTDGAYMYTSNRWAVPGSWDDDNVIKLRPYVCKVMRPPPPPHAPHPPRPPPPLSPGGGGGGGGGVGIFFLVVFILGIVGGGAFWVVRQRRAGQPILPAWARNLTPFGSRAQTRPGSDAAVYNNGMLAAGSPGATAYTPPLAGPAMFAAPNTFQAATSVPPQPGVPGGSWGGGPLGGSSQV